MRTLALLAALLFAGCHRSAPPAVADASTLVGPDLCVQMVDHMLELFEATGKLSFTQHMMMRGFKSQVVDQCRTEGLTQAQADCFLAVKKPEEMKQLEGCPALKAHPLRWLSMERTDSGEPEAPPPTKL